MVCGPPVAWLHGHRLGRSVMIWARAHFRSWRFRAKLDTGHELVAGGPFRFLRHPIYFDGARLRSCVKIGNQESRYLALFTNKTT